MSKRLSRLAAFDFSYEELHKNRDLGRLSERQLVEFRERITKPRLIIGIYAVAIAILFVLMLQIFGGSLWLVFPCGICGFVMGVGVWLVYDYYIDDRTEGDRVSSAKNIPKKKIQRLRYPIDEFTHRVEVDKFRALFTQEQYDALEDDTSFDFYYKPADYYHGDYRIFSVDVSWTPARVYRVRCWRDGGFRLPDIYELDLDPILDPMVLRRAINTVAGKTKTLIENNYDPDDPASNRLEWMMMHIIAVGQLAYGDLAAVEDVLESFSRIDSKSTFYYKISRPLMNALWDLLPIPKQVFDIDNLEKIKSWLDAKWEQLEWDEKQGLYVLKR